MNSRSRGASPEDLLLFDVLVGEEDCGASNRPRSCGALGVEMFDLPLRPPSLYFQRLRPNQRPAPSMPNVPTLAAAPVPQRAAILPTARPRLYPFHRRSLRAHRRTAAPRTAAFPTTTTVALSSINIAPSAQLKRFYFSEAAEIILLKAVNCTHARIAYWGKTQPKFEEALECLVCAPPPERFARHNCHHGSPCEIP